MIINLFGQPGAGKSTLAALIFAEMKLRGINCELVTEFAKQLTWQERQNTLANQIYVLGKQLERIKCCYGKVDYVITDSPLLLSILYNTQFSQCFNDLVVELHNKFSNYNYFVMRSKEYNPIGRNQTENESNEIGIKNEKMLTQYNISFEKILSNRESAIKIIDNLLTL